MLDKLPQGWCVVKVEDIVASNKNSCVGGPFGSNLTRKDYLEYPGVPVSRGSNLTLGERWFHDDDFVFVSEEKAASLIQNTAYPGDIIFTQRGTIGQVALIPKNSKFSKYILSQNQMKLTPDATQADVGFLLYYFLSPIAQEIIIRNSIGSTIPGFNLGQLRHFPIQLPPLAEQKAIAHILGTLDDKIELNREMNRTLEAMARAIFKSWFVDFDPVRAKMEGRQPAGMDAVTAELFPDELEDSVLGEIPKGWKVVEMGNEFKIIMGQSPPGETYNEQGDGLPFYQGRTDFGFRYPSLRVYCNDPTRLAQAGDTLVSVRAPVGDLNIAKQECCIGRGVAAVRHKNSSRSYTYYLMHTLNHYFERFEAEGTVFGSISKKDFFSLPYVTPPSQLIAKFEELAYPLDQLIENKEDQLSTVTEIRDTLLPKLLSGEIRVKDAEKLVETVA